MAMEGLNRLPKLDALTSLRFFAAAMLVVFHTDMLLFKATIAKAIALSQGVSFFFVLSGFILYYNYPRLETRTETWRFLAARFARIWPALAVVTAIVLIQLPFNHRATAGGSHLFAIVMTELAMVQSWIPNPNYYLGLNPPTWSISTEFAFYLVFPFLVMSWRNNWLSKLGLTALLTITSVIIACWLNNGVQSPHLLGVEQWLVYVSPVARLLEFVLGMTAAFFFLRVRPLVSTERSSHKRTISLLQWAALFLSAATMAFCGSCELGLPLLATLWLRTCGGCLAYALLIFVMAFSEGQIARLLRFPSMVFLGEISYSIYLLHVVFLFYMQDQVALRLLPFETLPQIVLALSVFITALVGSSALIYMFVEKPWRRAIMSKFEQWMSHRYKLLPAVSAPIERATVKIVERD
jgi:peptidoglycan/LPS O-acetylase OafA/YrhL